MYCTPISKTFTSLEASRALVGISIVQPTTPIWTSALGFDTIASSLFAMTFYVDLSVTSDLDNYFYIAIQESLTCDGSVDNYTYVLAPSIDAEP